MSEPTTDSESPAQRGTNGNGHSPLPEKFSAPDDAGCEAGFASGADAGHRQGWYQAGFSDGYKLASGSAGATAGAESKAAEAAKACGPRLRDLPCACGCTPYTDEAQCPRCKTPR